VASDLQTEISTLIAVFLPVAGLCLALAMWLVAVRRDLAESRASLAATLRDERFYRMIAEHASDGVVVHGLDCRVTWANPAYCVMMGRPLDQMIGRNPLSFALPPDIAMSEQALAGWRYDPDDPRQRETALFRNIRGDGTEFWNQISVAFFGDAGAADTIIMVCRDVTAQVNRENDLREASQRLKHAAGHDALTGLANRAGLMAFVQDALADRRQSRLGLLHVDLDRFKEINDTHGHSAGDAILVHVAQVLRTILRPGDMAARLGGDEFVVACIGLPHLDSLAQIGTRLIAALSAPLDWQGRTLSVRASIGADLAPEGDRDMEALFQRSDFALYEAKRAGRAQMACYDEAVHQRHTATKELSADLVEAIRTGSLSFSFQPVLDLALGQISTLETLVRWNHPRRGLLSPADFLPLAEELSLMADLDFRAMEAALNLKARLNALRPSSLIVALNASGALLSHPDFLTRLARGMVERGLTPAEIGIEVLETVVFDAPGSADPATEVISALRAAGHPVVLDDFGVGYAGLAHLAHLEVSGIKIDLSLVQAAKTDPTSVQILEAMIELCGRLGITSIAEGVDTVWMATRLQDMGCTRLQGWWLSPALPADDIIAWLEGHLLPPVADDDVVLGLSSLPPPPAGPAPATRTRAGRGPQR